MSLEQLYFDWLRQGAQAGGERSRLAGTLAPRALRPRSQTNGHPIEIDGRSIEVLYQRNDRARRYRLYLDRHGQPRVTIPRRGSKREAERFFERHSAWLAERLRRFAAQPGRTGAWIDGSKILFRGTATRLEIQPNGSGRIIRLGTEIIPGPPDGSPGDLRAFVETHLWRLGAAELPPVVLELAARHQCQVRRVSVRNQATRWGSCSRRGTISLNWRLVQVPVNVRDYIILHELMHLRELNHSPRFWTQVARVCPDFKECESWLRQHSTAIL